MGSGRSSCEWATSVSTAVETLVAHSHDERPLPTREAAEDAGLTRGYGLIDELLGRNAVQQSIDL